MMEFHPQPESAAQDGLLWLSEAWLVKMRLRLLAQPKDFFELYVALLPLTLSSGIHHEYLTYGHHCILQNKRQAPSFKAKSEK